MPPERSQDDRERGVKAAREQSREGERSTPRSPSTARRQRGFRPGSFNGKVSQVECPTCKVAPGEQCRVVNGAYAGMKMFGMPHVTRVRASEVAQSPVNGATVPSSERAHVCGPECEPGWRLRDIIEYGAVFGLPATQAVIAWDAMHKRDPATPRYEPAKEGVTYGT